MPPKQPFAGFGAGYDPMSGGVGAHAGGGDPWAALLEKMSQPTQPFDFAALAQLLHPSKQLGMGGAEITPQNPMGHPGGDPFNPTNPHHFLSHAEQVQKEQEVLGRPGITGVQDQWAQLLAQPQQPNPMQQTNRQFVQAGQSALTPEQYQMMMATGGQPAWMRRQG